MGKSTISMAIFHCFLHVHQRVCRCFSSDVFFTQVQHQHESQGRYGGQIRTQKIPQLLKMSREFPLIGGLTIIYPIKSHNVKGNTNHFFWPGLIFPMLTSWALKEETEVISNVVSHASISKKKIQSNWIVKHDLPICPLHGNRKSHRKSSIYPSKLYKILHYPIENPPFR